MRRKATGLVARPAWNFGANALAGTLGRFFGNFPRRCHEPLLGCFVEQSRAHFGDKDRQRACVHADRDSARSHGFDQDRATAAERIQHALARLRQRGDRHACRRRMHAPGIAVKAVRKRARQGRISGEKRAREPGQIRLTPRFDRTAENRECLTPPRFQRLLLFRRRVRR